MSTSIFERAKTHLLGGRGERYGFFLGNVHRAADGTTILIREFLPIPEDDVKLTGEGFELPPSVWLPARNRAHAENAVLVEAHSHPFGLAGFSVTDEEWGEDFARYMLDDLPSRPYAATVWSEGSVDGRMWPALGEKWVQLAEIRVVGPRLDRIGMTGAGDPSEDPEALSPRYARQLPAIGKLGQRMLNDTRVGLVGVGGLGSVSAQELAYAGVRWFVLVDLDVVDETSLNRLVGAGPVDVGVPKTTVWEREIRRIAGAERCEIRVLGDLRTVASLAALSEVDVLVGAVDNDAARLILNELAVAYMIPYFDLGVGIEAREGVVVEAGGRAIFVHPDGPCLLCVKGYSPRIAAEELMNPADRERAQGQGYVTGGDDPSPSVITLNTVVAGLGMTEFIAFVTGLRPPVEYVYYDLLQGGTVPTKVRRDPKCVVCACAGWGADIHIERYMRMEEAKVTT